MILFLFFFRKKEFLGSVKFSAFDTNSVHRDVVFVATEENVVASLSLKTGMWTLD